MEVAELANDAKQDPCTGATENADMKTATLQQGSVRRGVIVRLHSLESAPHLNGMLGLCLYRGKEDRWVINLDVEAPGHFRNVREQNLEFVCCGGAVQPDVSHLRPPAWFSGGAVCGSSLPGSPDSGHAIAGK